MPRRTLAHVQPYGTANPKHIGAASRQNNKTALIVTDRSGFFVSAKADYSRSA